MSTNTNSSLNQNEPLILDGTRVDDIRIYDDGITPTLKNRMGTGGNNVPFVAQEPFVKSRRAQSPEDHETWVEGGPAPTLNAFDNGTESRATVVIPIQDARPVDKKQNGLGIGNEGDPMFTLDRVSQPAAAIPIQGTIIGRSDTAGPNGPGFGQEGDPMFTVDTISMHGVATPMSVRRLTPIECERLMGWPDNHTLHRADGKTNADTTRYKMCGNGVASPVAQWIAESINNIL
jgi:site-specific DNA-cytosine methylase